MTTFNQILKTLSLDIHSSAPSHTADWQVQAFTGFVLDSRKVEKGQIFIALKGTNSTAEQMAQYINKALENGALAVVTEFSEFAYSDECAEKFPELKNKNILYFKYLRQYLGEIQQAYLQVQQAQDLARVVAVTGTNGKTTVSRLIAELLTLLQQPTAVMGTTGNGILPNLVPSTHTTLDALQLQSSYYQYSQQGAKFLSLEASSHGLEQGRLAGLPIEVASFSNLSRDHLDYHGTLQQYAQAKAELFSFTSLKYAIIHQDDDYADLMLEKAKNNSAQPHIIRFSMKDNTADYYTSDVLFSLNGANFNLHSPSGTFAVCSPLLGKFNVANVLQAIISVEKLGFNLQDIIQLVPQLKGASGRMQTISDTQHQRLFIVDYAHTPDALQQVLMSLRHHVDGKLWAVFGCGGDRDRGKRPMMTQVAMDYADKIILTSDNPRTEDPAQIMADMMAVDGLAQADVQSILDRREAIKYAVKHAQQGDIVVVAGKGHENYQEIDGVRHWFDDVVEVQSAVDSLGCALPNTVEA
ncbi:UDP-N-acetylmuramoyl-L-alanyl-D-glutamate--2,6-diaminopimelate ligase [Moraxella sp. ZY210820]|uniref:UDP-N-acetylmuramoyl-L-alanyl-D-glutamate--2, 6-diaminopimelate ligase n=1 Tax=Moraxella sp. ZY210820 TaxID=2904123 RepID=UPI00272F6311|nr:UDP-N-acetylmuramoyl-L-alanyl-D-glutamate--2,6-diaminopimelate ligase [Moraxella sp. ZY210820]WLF84094.1 UDP-N-acetylmuramoyl-L-alanyl-D-glutamate--2,6-diaminopimelate ligase [Moraxella sp. ZY210820]